MELALLASRSDADSKVENIVSCSSLYYAAHNGHREIVKLLLNNGGAAIASAADFADGSPLHFAATNGHEAVVGLLLQSQAKVNVGDRTNKTPATLLPETEGIDASLQVAATGNRPQKVSVGKAVVQSSWLSNFRGGLRSIAPVVVGIAVVCFAAMIASSIAVMQYPMQTQVCLSPQQGISECIGQAYQCVPVPVNSQEKEIRNTSFGKEENAQLALAELFESHAELQELPHNYTVGIAPFCVITHNQIIEFVKNIGLDLPDAWNTVVRDAKKRDGDVGEFLRQAAEKIAQKIERLGSLVEEACIMRAHRAEQSLVSRWLGKVWSFVVRADPDQHFEESQKNEQMKISLSTLLQISPEESKAIVRMVVENGGSLIRAFERVLPHVNSTLVMFEFENDSERALREWVQKGNSSLGGNELVKCTLPTILKELLKSIAEHFKRRVQIMRSDAWTLPSCEVVVKEWAHSINMESSLQTSNGGDKHDQEITLTHEQQEAIGSVLSALENKYNESVALALGINGEAEELYVYQSYFGSDSKKHEDLLGIELEFSLAGDGLFFVKLREKITSMYEAVCMENVKVGKIMRAVKILIERGVPVDACGMNNKTPLHVAAEKGYREVVELLIHAGADSKAVDLDKWTPLHFAAAYGHKEVVELLLAKGADIKAEDKDGYTAWQRAYFYDHSKVMELLSTKVSRGKTTKNNDSPSLHDAAYSGNCEAVEALLAQGAEVNALRNYSTALHFAADNGHRKIVEMLVSKGADIRALDKNLNTPLHLAAYKGYREVVELLLGRGAEIEAQNIDGATPLHFAAYNGHRKIVKMLVDRGSDIKAVKKDGATPLHCAAYNGHREIAGLLLANGADINALDANGDTPMHAAAHNDCREIVKLLLAEGADTQPRNGNGATPLHWAAYNGHREVVELLVSQGDEIEVLSTDGGTPLHWAACMGRREVVEVLVSKGADIKAADKNGHTPLHLAVYYGHEETVGILLAKGSDPELKNKSGLTAKDLARSDAMKAIFRKKM